MFKYIRTENKIISSDKLAKGHDEQLGDYYINGHGLLFKAIEESDYIEELLDKIAVEDVDDNNHNDWLIADVEETIYWYNWNKKMQTVDDRIYGAIWTDKGLTFVATFDSRGWTLLED